MVDDAPPGLPRLSPLPYHQDVVHYLRAQEPDVWRWACSAEAREEHAEAVRSSLLKETYRLDADAHPELHERCANAARRLGLQVPVTLYQAGEGPMNASLFFVPGHAHVVFRGPVLERLQGDELEALLGHELSHHLLWEMEGGVFHAADRILHAAAHDLGAHASHAETARRYSLYTEAFADRGGAVACGALAPEITTLVKVQTGLAAVSAASYLKQADEICKPGTASEGQSHPEVFVRARALRLWCEHDDGADTWLAEALEGPLSLDALDIRGQQRLAELTRRVMLQLLQPRSLRSEGLLAHARKFFPDFQPANGTDDGLADEVHRAPGTHDYLAALLTDFCAADRELDEVPLAASAQLAARLGMGAAFERFAPKALGLPKRQFNKIVKEAAAMLERAEKQHG